MTKLFHGCEMVRCFLPLSHPSEVKALASNVEVSGMHGVRQIYRRRPRRGQRATPHVLIAIVKEEVGIRMKVMERATIAARTCQHP